MRERLAVVCMLALLSVGSASAQTPCPPDQEPYAPLPGRGVPRDTVRERVTGLLGRSENARTLASDWLRDHGVDSAARVLGVPFGSVNASLTSLDARDRAAGWQALRHDTLATGRELRLWMHGYSTYGLRLTRKGDHVEGWMIGPEDAPEAAAPDLCARFRPDIDGTNGARCVYRWRATPDWRATWDTLDAAGIWMLPDASTVPDDPSGLVTDGASVTVELRIGTLYRFYRLSDASPDFHEAVRALWDVGHGLGEQRMTPDTVRVHGALWPEGNRLVFRQYGDTATWTVLGSPVAATLLPPDRTAATPLGAAFDGIYDARGDTAPDGTPRPALVVSRLVFLHGQPGCR